MKKTIAAFFAIGMMTAALSAAETQVYNANFKTQSVAWSKKADAMKVTRDAALVVDVVGQSQSIQIGTNVPAGLEAGNYRLDCTITLSQAGENKSVSDPQRAQVELDRRKNGRLQSRHGHQCLYPVHAEGKSGLSDPRGRNGNCPSPRRNQGHNQQREDFPDHSVIGNHLRTGKGAAHNAAPFLLLLKTATLTRP